jgi:glycosyltransferase involved in cell wall biosynthesis
MESRHTTMHGWSGSSSQPANQLVTVVTPSFNQASFLEETIRSVALQSYRPIQHIVVDGGSTDGSVDILKKCAEELECPGYTLDWTSEPDGGLPNALGKGFARARGEIVGWLNSDDVYFDRHVVKSTVNEFVKHPEVDLVHGDVALISENSGLWMIWCFPRFNYKRALRGYIIPQPTVFFRRYVVERHPIGSLSVVGVDHAYWLEIGRSHKFRHIHRVQAGDRDHAGRLTNVVLSQWPEQTRQYFKLYGDSYVPTPLDRARDVCTRLLMRFKGSIYLSRMFAQARFEHELVFPLWIDSPWKAFCRQFMMRLNQRPDLGPPPAFIGERVPGVMEPSRQRTRG